MLTKVQYETLKKWPEDLMPRVEYTPTGGLAVYSQGSRVGAVSTFFALTRKGLAVWVKSPEKSKPRAMVFIKVKPACYDAIRKYEEAQLKTKTHR